MSGKMNEDQLTIVKEYEIINQLMHKVDSIFDNCIRGCHIEYFHTFEYKCVYDIQLTNIGNTEVVHSTIADKSMNLYEINKKLKIARESNR